jgi:cytidyltransferase-like protein
VKKVFISGCYDILHAGHLQFFEEAKALGDHLVVSFASSEVLWFHKRRKPSIPDEHKFALLQGMRVIDEVVIGHGLEEGIDFRDDFTRIRPDFLVVTEDDKYAPLKRALCDEVGAEYVMLPKTPPKFEPVSTSSIVRWVQAPTEAPLRVDFAGGWLDVPRFSRPGEFVVNCAVSPLVSRREWPYEKQAGLGGSGAWALLNGKDGVDAEIDLGVGWQDPAVIRETGLCVWRSGLRPMLDFKHNGDFLAGRMAVHWTGKQHDTPGVANLPRDYDGIARSARIAREGALHADILILAEGVRTYHTTQLEEGMEPLPEIANAIATKYCGGGYGGYALHLFADPADRDIAIAKHPAMRPVEPFCRV